jgi:hypothetical protein
VDNRAKYNECIRRSRAEWEWRESQLWRRVIAQVKMGVDARQAARDWATADETARAYGKADSDV